jgi:hypothetical protein
MSEAEYVVDRRVTRRIRRYMKSAFVRRRIEHLHDAREACFGFWVEHG